MTFGRTLCCALLEAAAGARSKNCLLHSLFHYEQAVCSEQRQRRDLTNFSERTLSSSPRLAVVWLRFVLVLLFARYSQECVGL